VLRVQVGSVSDRLLVRMVTGQSIADFERACPELAASLDGHLARVWADDPGRLWLEVIRADALADVVPGQPIPDIEAVDEVTVGVREDGEPWRLRLLGTRATTATVSFPPSAVSPPITALSR
jgi:S-DNA-T family DNA segregation ATPase FtsK/SpoIIIE